ncbi:venom carboxylesterase-6-like [Neodiprion pinetum]|uniref:Carboxylic ester hydrolase n=1 Tax=Neodiprion lecontei TaxID=441921 RepID=A0ABM3GPX9_NEOLC|nr:venom carboxylesterase-6-like [Neodiprion pinetum]XP_046602304.1 venom carboxylesterase-6-like [Neodiprion lecontei]
MAFHIPVNYSLLTILILTTNINDYSAGLAQANSIVRQTVNIPQGTLLGTVRKTIHNRTVSAFLGIPYAQPPVGDLRFRNPVPADGWSGTRDATLDSEMCPQLLGNEVKGKEDCLWINAYTPKLPKGDNSSLLPVMVYIYGGAFTSGNARSDRYGPEYLLDANIVLFLPSHRVGPFGYLSTGDEVASGNWGLKDQILALKWVQNNARYFGGDPDRVTLFGASSGGACVHLLTLSDLTIGLFHKYITQSGSALGIWSQLPRSGYSSRAYELGEYVGCSNKTSAALVKCLREIDFAKIIATAPRFIRWHIWPAIVWAPTDEPNIEGAVFTDTTANIFAAGKIRDLPWISGVVRDEAILYTVKFFEDKELFRRFLENFDAVLPQAATLDYQPDKGAAYVDAVKSYYLTGGLSGNESLILQNVTDAFGDVLFRYPAYSALLQHHAVAKNPQYFYTLQYRGTFSNIFFSQDNPKSLGVGHGDDTFYIYFPELQFSPAIYNRTVTKRDLEVTDIMVQLWTSFAIDGTPTSPALNGTPWAPFSATEGNYLRIGNEYEVSLGMEHAFYKERMEFWSTVTEVTRKRWSRSA